MQDTMFALLQRAACFDFSGLDTSCNPLLVMNLANCLILNNISALSNVRADVHWSFDQDLEGVRSLGAVLIDASVVLPRQGMGPMAGLCRVPRLQGTAALQVM
jgi:hypothetical protein